MSATPKSTPMSRKTRPRKKVPRRKPAIASKKFLGTTFEEVFNIVGYVVLAALILSYEWLKPFETFLNLPKALLAVLIAVIVHIIPQKYIASKFGIKAEYQLWIPGLILSVLMMLIGFKVIVVGAMMVSAYRFSRFGSVSRQLSLREIGAIGFVGPIANIMLAFILRSYDPASMLYYIGTISGIIAFYNSIPVKPLDGGKMFLSSPVYWALVAFALFLLLTPSGLLSTIFTIVSKP